MFIVFDLFGFSVSLLMVSFLVMGLATLFAFGFVLEVLIGSFTFGYVSASRSI